MADKPFSTADYVARGILIGGSLGALVGWLFMDMRRAILLGGLAGILAALTVKSRRDRRSGSATPRRNEKDSE